MPLIVRLRRIPVFGAYRPLLSSREHQSGCLNAGGTDRMRCRFNRGDSCYRRACFTQERGYPDSRHSVISPPIFQSKNDSATAENCHPLMCLSASAYMSSTMRPAGRRPSSASAITDNASENGASRPIEERNFPSPANLAISSRFLKPPVENVIL